MVSSILFTVIWCLFCYVHSGFADELNLLVERSASGNATNCCSCLQQILGNKVSFPGDPVYNNEQSGLAVAGYWSGQQIDLKPSCRVTPVRAEDVAKAVKVLTREDCHFAVRSGGHTAWAGASNIGPEGVTIDLSALKKVDVDKARNVVVIGPGNRWGDVYSKLDALGVGTSGGRVSSVGVGGLTLGGGKSFFAGQRGFVCDNVVNFEIVTSKGQILQANDRNHPDLYKALKGGSNNFGIVTSITLRTFKQGKLYGGQVVYPASTLPAQLEALHHFTETSGAANLTSGEAEVIFALATGPDFQIISNYLTYTEPVPNPPELDNFTAIQPQVVSTLRTTNLTDLTIELNTGTPNGPRYLFATATFVNNLELMNELTTLANQTFQPLVAAKTAGILFSFVFQPLTKPMTTFGCGKNSLGLCPSDGNLMILDLTMQWDLAADDAKIDAAAKKIINGSIARAKARRAYNRYLYLNYASPWQEPIASYGPDNVKQLQAVSRKYDPTRVFQRLVDGYKLP